METMILDAMKEVERLSGLGSDKPVIEHLAYQYDGKEHTYSHRIEPTENGRKLGAAIEPFRPAKLEVSTLTGFIDAIKGGVTGEKEGKLVHVEDYLTVSVKRDVCDHFGKRDTLLTAKHVPLNAFRYDEYYGDPQKFIIALQVAFYTNEDSLYLQNLASHLDARSSIATDDDGINQTVKVNVGEVKTAEGKVRPRVKLLPRTTFDEAAPVEREFLIRLKQTPDQTPSIAIFAVDGTKWQGESMQAIKHYLAKHLTDWAILA